MHQHIEYTHICILCLISTFPPWFLSVGKTKNTFIKIYFTKIFLEYKTGTMYHKYPQIINIKTLLQLDIHITCTKVQAFSVQTFIFYYTETTVFDKSHEIKT